MSILRNLNLVLLARLSECFPATPSIIKKVLKNRNAILPSLIERHDDEIARHWRQLLNGEIQVSDELMQHLVSNFQIFC